MESGLRAALTAHEEILLRRVALDSPGVDVKQLERLRSLALVERSGSLPRLTALGRRRYEALAKAPLLIKQKVPLSLYIEATLAKYANAVKAAPAPLHEVPPAPSAPIHFDLGEWRQRTKRRLVSVREGLIEHRRRQIILLDTSRARMVASRRLLEVTASRLASGLLTTGGLLAAGVNSG